MTTQTVKISAQSVVHHKGGNMKKLQLSNKYIESLELNANGSITLFARDEKMFQLLLKRLFLFAETVDSGVEKVDRRFTFTSDNKKSSITFEKDTLQVFNVLHADYCINTDEHSMILRYIQPSKKAYKFFSVLDCLKSKRPQNNQPDEKSKLLPQNK
jgi:hypothetical protein